MPASFLCVLTLLSGADDPKPKPPEGVPVIFRVRVPAGTPKDGTVYISGNLEPLGAWKPDHVALKRVPDGRHAVTVLLPKDVMVEFKFTLGAWDRVEKDAEGKEIPNRTLMVMGDEPIEKDFVVGSWAVPGAARPASKSTVTGTVKTHGKFTSKILGNTRAIYVWLPPGYDTEPNRHYPVAYFQDGQNVFDAATSAHGEWRADETADRLMRENKIPPLILVGVANTRDRMNEYTPVRDEGRKVGGKGPLYAKFMVEELKPFIDKTYRTKPGRESTAVIGSSLGGLIAMEMALEHPEAFGLCGAVSPAIWWGNNCLIADARAHAEAARQGRFWIDMGTREGAKEGQAISPAVDRVKELASTLQADGLKPERDFHLEIVEGAEHNEAAWAARLDRILMYLFK